MPSPDHPDQPAGDEPRDERDPAEQPTQGGDIPAAGPSDSLPADTAATEPAGAGAEAAGPVDRPDAEAAGPADGPDAEAAAPADPLEAEGPASEPAGAAGATGATAPTGATGATAPTGATESAAPSDPLGGGAPGAEPSAAADAPTGPTEPLRSGDPLGGEPERPTPSGGRGGPEWPPPGPEADAGGGEPERPAPGAGGGAPPPGVPPTAQQPPGDGGADWRAGGVGPGDAPRRLTRSSSDRMLGGVAGGLGRYFGIDPIIFRIAFVVLAFAGGAGVLAYVAVLLFVPSDDPAADRSTGNRALRIVGGAVLVIAALSFLGPGLFFAGPGLVPLAVLVVIVVLLVRAARGGQGDDITRVLARIGLVLVVIALAGAGAVAVALGAAVGGGTLIAAGVIVAGVALAAAGFFGGARWMILPALVLAVPLGVVAASDLSLDGGTGERDYRPTTLASLKPDYRLGAGEMRLDLTRVRLPEGDTPLRLSMGMGHVEVIVPDNVCVASNVDVRMGYAEVPGRADGGFDVDYRELPASLGGNPRLVIDADMSMGAIEVLRPGERGLDRTPGERWDEVDRVSADDNAACERTT
jgi:phage shock protein PspC (stress-responsive transcriptional regulator)